MIHLSGSSLERASLCIGSAVLPRVDSVNRFALRGNVWHEFLFNVREHGLDVALQKAPEEHREALGAMDFDRLPLDPAQYAAEVAFAYDWRTGKVRELGRGLTRQQVRALCRPDEIPGTADVVSLGDDWVTVLDYKTGWKDYGPVGKFWQLAFYALCAARCYGMERARVGIVRLKEDGSCYFEMAELDFFDLEDVAMRLDALVESALAAERQVASGQVVKLCYGEHCRDCPSMPYCPAMTSLVREVAREAVGPEIQISLSEETAPAIYERLRAVRHVMDRMETALEAWAAEHPIPLASGKVYGRTKLPRDVFDPECSEPIFKTLFGEEFAQRAIDRQPRITKDGLRRALAHERTKNKALKVEPTLKHILARLKEEGALTTKYTYPVMAHRPRAISDEEGTTDAGRQDGAVAIRGDATGQADGG